MSALIIFSIILLVIFSGIVWWYRYVQGARAFNSAVAFVNVSYDCCAVSKSISANGFVVDPKAVTQYLREELHLTQGSKIAVVMRGNVMASQVAELKSELTAAGYKIAGVMTVGFLTQPGSDDKRYM